MAPTQPATPLARSKIVFGARRRHDRRTRVIGELHSPRSRPGLSRTLGHNGDMAAAGLLLTGGASRRMGQDKAALIHPEDGQPLARRLAARLLCATSPAIEVGPGRTDLPTAVEDPPGMGPLAAVVAGQRSLDSLGWSGPVLVVATDLPRLTPSLLVWLAGHPSPRSVVPVANGVPQPLCARYAAADLVTAASLVAAGARAMRDLLASIDAVFVGPELWARAAGDPDALVDMDTPADLALLRADG
jgi:molybdopterin-guanine dinucleotide biosynthesis protein A